MRDQKTKAQRRKTKKLWDNTHPLSPHPHPDVNQLPPTYPIPPPSIIHNNKTMDTELLVQMRHSNTCGSARNDEIFNLSWRSGAGPDNIKTIS